MAIAAALIVALPGCSSGGLSLADWSTAWEATVTATSTGLESPLVRETCESTLAYLREQRVELEPTPLADLEGPVRAWFDLAEDLAFECDRTDDIERLGVLADEVDVVLDAEG